jgi:hypothetical protein
VKKSLLTLAKSVNVCLAPLTALCWGYDKIAVWLPGALEDVFTKRGVPPERLKEPEPDIAVPAIEAMRYSKLREQYVNLLAASMDSGSDAAHPSFVDVIKQLTPDEAKIIRVLPPLGKYMPIVNIYHLSPMGGRHAVGLHFSRIAKEAGCEGTSRAYFGNLIRLGIAEIPLGSLANLEEYSEIEKDIKGMNLDMFMPEAWKFHIEKNMFGLTVFGDVFRKVCLDV